MYICVSLSNFCGKNIFKDPMQNHPEGNYKGLNRIFMGRENLWVDYNDDADEGQIYSLSMDGS